MGANVDGRVPSPAENDIFWLPFSLRLIFAIVGCMVGYLVISRGLALIYLYWYNHNLWLTYLPILCLWIVTLPIAIAPIWGALSMRLVVTPLGIEYHEPGLTIMASWSDVLGLGQTAQGYGPGALISRRFFGGQFLFSDQLLLKASQVRSVSFWVRYNHWLGRDLVIPIGLFSLDWRNSKVRQSIHRHAHNLREFGSNDERQIS